MKKYSTYGAFLVMMLILLIFPGCEESDQEPDISEEDTLTFQKSFKRGLSYNLVDPLDLDTLKRGVSWWYNWHFTTAAPNNYYEDYQMEFIPMLWGGNAISDYDYVKTFILDHPEINYLLVLNEPNLTDQVNMTPERAAVEWVKYETLIDELESLGRQIELVGPAMNWGTLTNYWDPVVWLDAFYVAYRTAQNGNDPLIDYLAFHWYDYGLESQLDRLQKYGKQIWITEMANWNANIDSYIKQAEQMTEMVHICETRDDVFRYAWFIGRGFEGHYSNLFDSEAGKLNMLGELYISLPYTE